MRANRQPSVTPPGSGPLGQDISWQGLSGAQAWRRIYREAHSWPQVDQMMAQWADANKQRVSASDADDLLQFVLLHGLPLCRNGKYRYHGVSQPIWHDTPEAAIQAARQDFLRQ